MVIERPQHVGASAGAEYQRRRPVEQMKRQGHGLLVEIVERLEVAGEARHGGHAVAVCKDAELLRRRQPGGKTQAGRVTQRHARALDHAEATERPGAFGDDAGFGCG